MSLHKKLTSWLARWLNSDNVIEGLFPKRAIDDVLVLSTGENLEQHAETAAEEADRQLISAANHEAKTEDVLAKAEANHELAVQRRFNKAKLVQSITSVIERLR